jgi:2-polyprenyl-3-methyl-5-hydroxy-6-metoxy-1,4-benzoquinol methylase
MNADPRLWNDIAESYAARPVEDPAAFERKIALTKARMHSGQTVLDIGCGTGSLALRLADTGAEVHGLDLSPEMVRIARGKAADAVAERVHFHVGPFDDSFTTFGPSSLDGVCAYSILHLVEDLPGTLAHIHRMLKPGGFFVSSTVCLAGGWVPYGPLLWAMRAVGKAPWVALIRPDDLQQAMVDAGFVDVEAPDVGVTDKTVCFVVARKPA